MSVCSCLPCSRKEKEVHLKSATPANGTAPQGDKGRERGGETKNAERFSCRFLPPPLPFSAVVVVSNPNHKMDKDTLTEPPSRKYSTSIGDSYVLTVRWQTAKRQALNVEALHKGFYDKYVLTLTAAGGLFNRKPSRAFTFISDALANARFLDGKEGTAIEGSTERRSPFASVWKSEDKNVIVIRVKHLTEYDDEKYELLLKPEEVAVVDKLRLRVKDLEAEVRGLGLFI